MMDADEINSQHDQEQCQQQRASLEASKSLIWFLKGTEMVGPQLIQQWADGGGEERGSLQSALG